MSEQEIFIPKILVGSPTYEGKEYCLPLFAEAVANLVYPEDKIEFCFVDNTPGTDRFTKVMNAYGLPTIYQPTNHIVSTKKMAQNSNWLREKAIKEKFDFIFSLETDMKPNPWTLTELLACYFTLMSKVNKTEFVVGSFYNIYGGGARTKCAYSLEWNITDDTVLTTGLGDWKEIKHPYMPVQSCGLGATLIPVTVLEKIPFRGGIQTSPDAFFFSDLVKYRMPAFVYTGDVLNHANRGDWKDKVV